MAHPRHNTSLRNALLLQQVLCHLCRCLRVPAPPLMPFPSLPLPLPAPRYTGACPQAVIQSKSTRMLTTTLSCVPLLSWVSLQAKPQPIHYSRTDVVNTTVPNLIHGSCYPQLSLAAILPLSWSNAVTWCNLLGASVYCRQCPCWHLYTGGNSPTGQVDAVLDIEENIWSPVYGLKGKVDVTLQAPPTTQAYYRLRPYDLNGCRCSTGGRPM